MKGARSFLPRQSCAVHLLKKGDVYVEYGDPTTMRWTVREDAKVVRPDKNKDNKWVELYVEGSNSKILYQYGTRVKLWHDSQFTPYNFG